MLGKMTEWERKVQNYVRKPSEKFILTHRGILGGRVAVEGLKVGIRNKMLAPFSLGAEQISNLSPLSPGIPAKSDMCMF